MNIGIFVPNWVGDAVMAFPFINVIRRECPNDRIIIIGRAWVTELFKHHPAVDEIISLTHSRGPIGTTRAGLNLRKLNLGVTYLLSDSWRCAYLARLFASDCRIGFRGQWRSALLTRAEYRPRGPLHRSERYLRLIGSPEIGLFDGLAISQEESAWGRAEMGNLGLKSPLAVFPSSVAQSRRVPINKWIEILTNSGRVEKEVLFFGSDREQDVAKALTEQLDSAVSICGNYTLRKSVILISLCEGAIGTDSGLGHIAANLGLPTLSLFGAGDPAHTAPQGPRAKVVRTGVHCSPCRKNVCGNWKEPLLCLTSLDAKEVWETYSSL